MPVHAGAVAAGHSETANAARTILENGGNAFDAALAAFLAACVAEPVLASLGGGGFLTSKTAEGAVETFDFFTQTPLQPAKPDQLDFYPVTADFGPAQQQFHIGRGAIATPGAVAGLFAVHDAHGFMPLVDIAAPAIELASRGVALNAFQAYLLSVVGPIYLSTPESVAQFCTASPTDGPKLLSLGEAYRPSGFVDFLSALIREGSSLFYKDVAARALEAMAGASIGPADLATYTVLRREPLAVSVGGADVFVNPPPAIGGALIVAMLHEVDRAGRYAPETFVEAMRRCNRFRPECRIDLEPEAGALKLAELMGHPPSYRGTTHFSVADGAGNVVAMTVSNGEGSGIVVPGTGMMLNNMLGEEDLNQAGLMAWPTNQRLSSMMAPGVVRAENGTWTAFGSGGSNRIRSALAQVLAALIFDSDTVSDAVERPRLHLEGGVLSAEPGFDEEDIKAALEQAESLKLWPERNMFFGGAHLVSKHADGHVSGAGDPRRDGVFLVV